MDELSIVRKTTITTKSQLKGTISTSPRRICTYAGRLLATRSKLLIGNGYTERSIRKLIPRVRLGYTEKLITFALHYPKSDHFLAMEYTFVK
jgi:hypothetical protein